MNLPTPPVSSLRSSARGRRELSVGDGTSVWITAARSSNVWVLLLSETVLKDQYQFCKDTRSKAKMCLKQK